MLKRIAAMCLVFSLLMTFIPAGPVHAAPASLAAPQGVTVSAEGTQFIIKWQNPSSISELAKTAYDNYEGVFFYIVDWRVNNGAWHFDREVPGEQYFFDYYPNCRWRFVDKLCDDYGDITGTLNKVDKVMVGVPYNTTVGEWLKKNKVEFRVRYLNNYYSESLERMDNQYSAFSNIVSLGNPSPTGSTEPGPVFNEYGVPAPPSTIQAPQELVSELVPEYMTIKLRWKVPEDIKTLTVMNTEPVLTAIDWKMNNGEWYEGIKYLKDPIHDEYILEMQDLTPDKYGYANITLRRGSLKIPPGMSISPWLADNTYYFRARYVLMPLEEKGPEYIFSPYSNTVAIGRGTKPQQTPIRKR